MIKIKLGNETPACVTSRQPPLLREIKPFHHAHAVNGDVFAFMASINYSNK